MNGMKWNKSNKLRWKCNTPYLIKEIIECNPTAGVLRAPMQIFLSNLGIIAERAIELNDPILNKLMFDMSLYDHSIPSDPDYEKYQKYIADKYDEYLSQHPELCSE